MSKQVQFGEAKQKELDGVVRKLAQESKAAVEGCIEQRLSYQDEGKVQWQAYSRFLLSNKHVVFVNLRTMEGSVSEKPLTAGKLAKIEAKAKRVADRATRKAAREAKKLAPKVKIAKASKAEVKKMHADAERKAIVGALSGKKRAAYDLGEVTAYQKQHHVSFSQAKEAVRLSHRAN
jgi:hypothetical protein